MRLLNGSNGSDWPGVVVSGTTATFEQAEATDKRVDRPWLPVGSNAGERDKGDSERTGNQTDRDR
jgi:hypothetical protein